MQHPLERVVGEQTPLLGFEVPSSAHVGVVAGEPDFLDVATFDLVEIEERRLEFQSALVDGNCVADVLGGWLGNVLVGFTEEGDFELADAVDAVEETEEVDFD